jgi:hypothetical protein
MNNNLIFLKRKLSSVDKLLMEVQYSKGIKPPWLARFQTIMPKVYESSTDKEREEQDMAKLSPEQMKAERDKANAAVTRGWNLREPSPPSPSPIVAKNGSSGAKILAFRKGKDENDSSGNNFGA